MVKDIIIALTLAGERQVVIVETNIIAHEGICKRCHRRLKDAHSIQLGLGKICYNKSIANSKNYLFEMEASNETATKERV